MHCWSQLPLGLYRFVDLLITPGADHAVDLRTAIHGRGGTLGTLQHRHAAPGGGQRVDVLLFSRAGETLHGVPAGGAISIMLVLFTLQLSFAGVVWALTFCNAGLALAGGLLLWRRSDSENGS